MRALPIIVLCLLLFACNQFKVKKVHPESILEDELKTFDWSVVDEYPKFENCNSDLSKQEQQQCFEKTVRLTIINYLQDQNYVVTEAVNDTLLVTVVIPVKTSVKLNSSNPKNQTATLIPTLKKDIEQSVKALPRIEPAIKRGQFVKTQFTLPVIIAVN